MGHRIVVRTMEVVEDSTFCVLPSKMFFEICDKYSAFSDYFSDTFGKQMLSRSYAAIIAKTLQPKETGLQFFNQPLTQIYSRDAVFCNADDSIRDAARIMVQRKSSYTFIRSSASNQVGIVTEKDFARKVIAKGYPIDKPVESIMSAPLRTVSENALVFEAMMTMMEEDFQHVGVVDVNDKIVGMLSNKDILTYQGQSPLFLLREIQIAANLETIIEKHHQLPGLVRGLIHNGATAKNVTRFITTVSDTILDKLMSITLDEMGSPPVPFVFMIMGSEGRQEQTLKTDQDNAIVIDDFRVLNEDGLRYANEFVRHKILDFLGDIAVMGTPIIGHFIINKSGHSLNHAMLKKLSSNKKYWERVTLKEPGRKSKESFTIPAFGPMEPFPA